MASAAARIEITVNGRRAEVSARTLAELIAAERLGTNRVATALNGDFVPEARRDTTLLSPGDRVEIVSPRQGG